MKFEFGKEKKREKKEKEKGKRNRRVGLLPLPSAQ
jgi:hypothetical protein